MLRPVARLCLSLTALSLVAAPAAAELFTVTLTNGSVIETQYQPQEASWDHGMVLLMTEVGNWVGVPKSEVKSVVSEITSKGYGIVINTTTVLLGTAPNDASVPGDGKAAATDPVLAALQALQGQQQAAPPPYSIQQFVEPGETQGIPSGFISPYASPPSSQQ